MTSTPSEPAAGGQLRTDQAIGVIEYPIEPSHWFPFRHSDWKRIRERADTLADRDGWVGQLGWTAVGVAAAALIGLLPWRAAYSQLPQADQVRFGYVSGVLATTAVLSGVLAVVCLAVAKTLKGRDKASLISVLKDMDDCYTLFTTKPVPEKEAFDFARSLVIGFSGPPVSGPLFSDDPTAWDSPGATDTPETGEAQ